jgi:hypothetical protein
MSQKPIPSGCWLESLEVWRVIGGRKVWRSHDGARLYTWDSAHGEIEVFNKLGWHLGALEARTGRPVKFAVKGRRIDVG